MNKQKDLPGEFRGNDKKKLNNAGFTFVEVIATVAIIVILLAVSGVAVAQWRDPLKITELDNAARAIYMAAENRALLLQSNGVAKTTLTAQIDNPSAPASPIELKQLDIGMTKGDGTPRYFRLLSETSGEEFLDELLPTGVIDPALRNENFYILYDESSGHVFEVFYAENSFGDDLLDDLRSKSRKERLDYYVAGSAPCLVGHYGDGLADGFNTPTPPPPPELKHLPTPGVKVEIINDNELTLTVTYTLPPESDFPDGVGVVKITPDVTLCYPEGDKTYTVKLLYEDDVTGSVVSNFPERLTYDKEVTTAVPGDTITYTWVLDSLSLLKLPYSASSLDSLADDKRFKKLFAADDMPDSLGGKFSVEVNLKLSADGCTDGSYSDKDENNSLFDSETDNKNIRISNLRHLQNLDKEFSGAAVQAKVIQIKDIDCEKYNGTAYEFIPIENDKLSGYTGTENGTSVADACKIYNLKITPESIKIGGKVNVNAGLFSGVNNNFNFEYVHLIDSNIQGENGSHIGGLAGTAPDTIFKECYLENITVKSPDAWSWSYVGGLAGYWWGNTTFTDCKVKNITATSSGANAGGLAGGGTSATFANCVVEKSGTGKIEINGVYNAGGFVGALEGFSVLNNCQIDGAKITSNNSAGGLVGNGADIEVRNGSKTNNVEINGVNYAGGMVGILSKTSTFVGCDVANANVTGSGTGSEAGGVIGRATGANLDNCSAKSITVKGYMNAGGLVGGVVPDGSDNYQFDNSHVENSNITADNYAGGLVGNATRGILKSCKVINNTTVIGSGTDSEAGGVIGRATGTELESCSASGITVKSSRNAGGLVGGVVPYGSYNSKFSNSDVTNSNITAESYVGGMVGNAVRGTFNTCKAVNAKVSGTGGSSVVGGLIGRMQLFSEDMQTSSSANDADLRWCGVYWENNYPSSQNDYKVKGITAGGLIGEIRNGANIQNSFAATVVRGDTYAGGLIGNYAPAEFGSTFPVMITNSYTDCYISSGSFAGGLIGMKEQDSLTLTLTNVYTAGFINITGGAQMAAGLYSGWATGTTATNVYTAMYYEGATTVFPLTYGLVNGGRANCYWLKYNGVNYQGQGVDGWSYGNMCTLNMGGDFVKANETGTYPYKIDNVARGEYPFPVLKNMPHYGDWRNHQ